MAMAGFPSLAHTAGSFKVESGSGETSGTFSRKNGERRTYKMNGNAPPVISNGYGPNRMNIMFPTMSITQLTHTGITVPSVRI